MVCVFQPRNEVFPHGSVAQFRCKEPLGMYKLLGESELQCNNGAWDHRMPSCIPTTYLTNYTGECIAPTLLSWYNESCLPTTYLSNYTGQ